MIALVFGLVFTVTLLLGGRWLYGAMGGKLNVVTSLEQPRWLAHLRAGQARKIRLRVSGHSTRGAIRRPR